MNGQNRRSLLQNITEISFAAYDTLLFLDTHPDDQQAMAEYGRQFGPLTVDCASVAAGNHWQWINQPWPWEGGAC